MRGVGGRALGGVGAFCRAVVGALLLRRRLRELERRDHFAVSQHKSLEKLFINATGSRRRLFALAVDAEGRTCPLIN